MGQNLPWYVFVLISVAGMVVPLISRIFENRHQIRLKTLEVILNRKLDCYTNYIKSASEFGYKAQEDGPEYNEYLKSYYTARLVAPPEVKDAMKKIAQSANVMRAAGPGGFEVVEGLEKSWQEAVDRVTEEMAEEIEKLAEVKS